MERLTDKRFAKEGYFELTQEERESLYIPTVEEIYRKLAEYEDREEKGELVIVKHGKWIYNSRSSLFSCSCCGEAMARNVFLYCPWCGAKMDLEE